MGFLYLRPLSSYLETREQLAERRAEVATLRAERAACRGAARACDEPRRARTRGASDRLRAARGAPLHREGHRRLEPAAHGRVGGRRRRLSTATDCVRAARPGYGGGVDDRTAVARQLGREPRTFRRVVARCPWGLPAVTEQDPYGPDGEPFPTTYYLTCRHLVAAVSRLEAAGGVERWSATIADDPGTRERARARDRPSRRGSVASSPPGETGSDGGRVARHGDRRLAAARRRSSASTRMSRSRSPTRATGSARRCSPRSPSAGRRAAVQASRSIARDDDGRGRAPRMGGRQPALRRGGTRSCPRRRPPPAAGRGPRRAAATGRDDLHARRARGRVRRRRAMAARGDRRACAVERRLCAP